MKTNCMVFGILTETLGVYEFFSKFKEIVIKSCRLKLQKLKSSCWIHLYRDLWSNWFHDLDSFFFFSFDHNTKLLNLGKNVSCKNSFKILNFIIYVFFIIND